MFVDREEELDKLEKQFSSNSRTAVLVYGKRRVGKSTLIAQAAKVFDGTVVEHLCAQSSYEGNLELLCRSVGRSLGLPTMRFDYLQDLFDFLNGLDKRILLVIDEYQYLKQSRTGNEVDSLFQAIVDSLSPNVKLVLCGSFVTVMRKGKEKVFSVPEFLVAGPQVEGDSIQFALQTGEHGSLRPDALIDVLLQDQQNVTLRSIMRIQQLTAL